MITECMKNQIGSPKEYREIYKSVAIKGPSLPQNFIGFYEPQIGEDIKSEGPEKVTRGGEWELFKIPHRNFAYIPKSTRCPSILARPRPSSYWQAIGA
jgi:hypothetical protein